MVEPGDNSNPSDSTSTPGPANPAGNPVTVLSAVKTGLNDIKGWLIGLTITTAVVALMSFYASRVAIQNNGSHQNPAYQTQIAFLQAQNEGQNQVIQGLTGRDYSIPACIPSCAQPTPQIATSEPQIITATPFPPNDLESRLYCLDKTGVIETPDPALYSQNGVYTRSLVREITGAEKLGIIDDYFTLQLIPQVNQCIPECTLKIEYDLDTVTNKLYEVKVVYGTCGITPVAPSPTPTQPHYQVTPTKTPTPTNTLVPTTTPGHNDGETPNPPFDDPTNTPAPTTTPGRDGG